MIRLRIFISRLRGFFSDEGWSDSWRKKSTLISKC